MKTKPLSKNFPYTGAELRPLWNYLEHGLLGDSAVAWVGPCEVLPANMKDGEDLLAGSAIRGSKMLHLVIEVFDVPLIAAVMLQRMVASIAKDLIEDLTKSSTKILLKRSGDDLFWQDQKLSISIATPATRSCLVHFALNVTNEGTPVKTCSLEDFGLDATEFSKALLAKIESEWSSSKLATWKVFEV